MPAELTPALQTTLDREGLPLRVVDPRTNSAYVLIPAELFDRLRPLLDDAVDDRLVARLIHENMADDDANDPLLAGYQNFGK